MNHKLKIAAGIILSSLFLTACDGYTLFGETQQKDPPSKEEITKAASELNDYAQEVVRVEKAALRKQGVMLINPIELYGASQKLFDERGDVRISFEYTRNKTLAIFLQSKKYLYENNNPSVELIINSQGVVRADCSYQPCLNNKAKE